MPEMDSRVSQILTSREGIELRAAKEKRAVAQLRRPSEVTPFWLKFKTYREFHFAATS